MQTIREQYNALLQKLKNDEASTVFHSMGTEYLPYFDSLQGTLIFFNTKPQSVNFSKILTVDITYLLKHLITERFEKDQ